MTNLVEKTYCNRLGRRAQLPPFSGHAVTKKRAATGEVLRLFRETDWRLEDILIGEWS